MIEKTRRSSLTMFDILSLVCVAGALALLVALSIIDLRHWILPDELNFALGLTGLVFHFGTGYFFFGITDMLLGAALGAGLLYLIRYIANKYYGRDALGLGDVKLLGAAGLWLGVDGVLLAITLGALAGLLHGFFYAAWLHIRHKESFSVVTLSIPAGPGFAAGICAAGAYMFHPYIAETVHDLLA